MRTTLTIDVEIEQLTCCRCGKTALADPWELRRRDAFSGPPPEPDEAPWRSTSWRSPEGWNRWSMPGANDLAACPDCWPDVERSGRAFLQLIRLREPFNRND